METSAISIRDLKLSCTIGFYPHERLKTQTLCAQIELRLSCIPACETDSLSDTVNYEALEEHLVSIASQSNYLLIERLAKVLLSACLKFDSRIHSVRIELEKPGCLKHARAAAISLYKERSLAA